MKLVATTLAAVMAIAVSQSARAQDASSYMGVFSTVAEGFGQSVGQSLGGGQSVFVYAQGRAKLPVAPPSVDAYLVQVSDDGPTAADAAGKRDALIAKLRGVAQRFNVTMDVSEQTIAFGDPCARAGRRGVANPAACEAMSMAGDPTAAPADGKAAGPPKPEFTARAALRFPEPVAGQGPAFLDALHAAGADNIGVADDQQLALYARMRANPLGFGVAAPGDDKVWEAASRDAVRAARSQASILAQADGREVGEARQILFLTRTANGGDATVTVAVRFELLPAKH
jgi:hypothetical protein